MKEADAQGLFAEMEQKYRLGFELDPDYYTGVNVVMALRWSGRLRDDAFRRDFNEVLTVSGFLARLALNEDPQNFWAAATLAELTLHEALEWAPLQSMTRYNSTPTPRGQAGPARSRAQCFSSNSCARAGIQTM